MIERLCESLKTLFTLKSQCNKFQLFDVVAFPLAAFMLLGALIHRMQE